MRITTWEEYGVTCALHLAKGADDGPVTGRELLAAGSSVRRRVAIPAPRG